ncbi:hypothetical protein LRK_05920 [Lacticaseibacillus rhamnosus K32]|uniref:DUF1642 domain-containing protein n=1 Tax=Lacticaseibacillus rhamnosus TaxID=47715 RepID=UPI0004E30C50|nr:DUF1642 domain-containing protein [Lacticaseibacillus rhamnosus]KFC36397.1 hypothetical protein LRK_05920 [Lacticaseibacillus rhamnosus K32]WHM90675.1 DUF1642 domain-containing protein [Lacticaseibacillus rhamnosus]
MSEEKLYAVKNYEGKWLCIEAKGCHYWSRDDGDFFDQHDADILAHVYGGHVVELIEKPNPEVVSKEEAKILDRAKTDSYPANYISMNAHPDPGANGTSYEELRLMRALVNGYTVAKEKKYNVKVPHTDDSYFYKVDDEYCNAGDSYYLEGITDKKCFTDAEIEHYGLGDCEKVWCDSDDE